MKAKTKRKQGRRSKATAAKARTKTRAKPRPKPSAKAATKSKGRALAKSTSKSKSKSKSRSRAAFPSSASSKWVKFVEKHGIVLASARGPVPSIAEAVAGEPIVGSWWAHKKGKAIFAALSEIDDSPDVRCFKLVDGKVTFAHRKIWPALVRLGHDGIIATEQLSSVQQEHLPTGEHRNIVTPFPDWVDDSTASAAATLAADKARAQLAFIDARG